MIISNIQVGKNTEVHESSAVNNSTLGDNVKIAKRCSVFGSPAHPLRIGSDSYVGMNSVLNGFSAALTIGKNCSIAQNVNIMTDSGPNASERLQRIYPIQKKAVSVGDHCWIGAGSVIMPGVELGKFCVVAANSFVNNSFEDYCLIGGTPAKLIRKLSKDEIDVIES